jgi:chromosome segregation ATPase
VIQGGRDGLASHVLVAQNRSLGFELSSYKRKLSDAKRELELMRGKSREMETLVSLIQRSWSQLDIDASMLLDVLGGAESLSLTQTNSDLLLQFLRAGQEHRQLDPTDTSATQMKVDEWSTLDEIENEKSAALHRHPKDSTNNDDYSKKEFALAADIAEVSEAISNHTQFTLTLLERICVGISESGIFENVPELVMALSDHKAWQSERLLLSDRIAKLSEECIEANAKLVGSEKKRVKCERDLDKCMSSLEACREKLRNRSASADAGDTVGSNGNETAEAKESSDSRSRLSSELEQEYKDRIALLEKQLAESESAKSKVEMTLTERLSRPLTQTEAQIADMRRAMEELRAQCKQRVSALFTEVCMLSALIH